MVRAIPEESTETVCNPGCGSEKAKNYGMYNASP